MVANGPVS